MLATQPLQEATKSRGERQQQVRTVAIVAREQIVAPGAAQGNRDLLAGHAGHGQRRQCRRVGEGLVVRCLHGGERILEAETEIAAHVGNAQAPGQAPRRPRLVEVAVAAETDGEGDGVCTGANRAVEHQRRVDAG